MIRVGLVAGETSGDLLGAGLINELKNIAGPVHIEGIGGERLIAAGLQSKYPMELLSVMGITEVLGRYRTLKKARDELRDYFIDNPPDIFIGIDAPDFNLTLERQLKQAGIKTIHYVSPSIWAWREYRIHKIKKSIDLMLTLFPFETEIYKQHDVTVSYVGHPLADALYGIDCYAEAKQGLSVPKDKRVVAVLPGSRMNEINIIGPVLLDAVRQLAEKNNDLYFISGLANQSTYDRFAEIVASKDDLPEIHLHSGKTHQVMQASDFIMIASGTATLEAMLLNRPMVVAYRLSSLTYYIVKALAKIPFASLPNILAGNEVVTECLQHDCNADRIAKEMQYLIDNPQRVRDMKQAFIRLSAELAVNANRRAAESVLKLVEARQDG